MVSKDLAVALDRGATSVHDVPMTTPHAHEDPLFDVTNAATGSELLRPRRDTNTVCRHIGHYHGANSLAADLNALEIGESYQPFDPLTSQRINIRRVA